MSWGTGDLSKTLGHQSMNSAGDRGLDGEADRAISGSAGLPSTTELPLAFYLLTMWGLTLQVLVLCKVLRKAQQQCSAGEHGQGLGPDLI